MPKLTPSPPATPVKSPTKRLRFAHEDAVNYAEPVSESSDDEVLFTPPGRQFNPAIQDTPSPPDSRYTPLPREQGYIPRSVVGGQLERNGFTSVGNDDCPQLHPALDTQGASYIWDMATSPEDLEILLRHGSDFAATHPRNGRPVAGLIFDIEGIYQWPIEINSRASKYLTLRDTLMAIHNNVMKFVAKSDVDELHEHTRTRVYKIREARCREFGLDLSKEGVRRIDFLLKARRFLGVTPSSTQSQLLLASGSLPLHD